MRVMIILACALTVIVIASASAIAADEIIITSNFLKPYAEELAEIHKANGISSEIVTVEEIWKNYTPAKDPPIFGAANETLKDITGYNYTLAKKIIAFLRTQIGKAKYVTLFGDVKIIPPSYYVDLRPAGLVNVPETPTDFFYASPNYDMKPDFAVGRIPVSNPSEAQTYVDKLRDYYENFSLDAFRNVLLYGGYLGTLSGIENWDGEISVAHLMWENVTGKFKAKIIMESDGLIPGHGYKFDNNTFKDYVRASLNDAFSGGYGLVFHSQHGTPDGIAIYGPMYTKGDLAKIKEKKNAVLPIFISEGCSVAAYDTELVKSNFFTLYPPYDKSFAEYLLVIKAGAIASIGASRSIPPTTWKFEIVNGTINFTDYDYTHVITARILEDIGKVKTLGDAFKDALTYYSEKYDLKPVTPEDERGKEIYQTFFEIILLGDPTLKLPKLEINPVKPPKVEILSKPEEYIKVWDGIEQRYYEYPLYEGGLTIYVDGNATVKVFDPINLIERKVVHGTYTFTPSKYGKYLMRISNGKSEIWFTFYAEPVENHAPIVESIGVINATVGEKVVVKINASDPDGDEITCKPISLPEGAKIENFTFYWKPTEPGNYTVEFAVVDSKGASTEGSFTVHVEPRKVEITPVYPPNNAKNIPLSPKLEVEVKGAENYTVEFYGNGELIGTSNNGSIVWKDLKPGTTYEWFVVVVVTEFGNYTSQKWNFTTSYAPIANFSYEVSGRNVTFKFTGNDPDGGNVTCYWNFGDGSTAIGCEVTHTYAKDGTYNVTLTVVDETNVSSSITKRIKIKGNKNENQGPPMSKDLDGDGLYEDINGDGKFDINDIVYFQWHFRDTEFQQYKQYYDFWPDGKLDYKDVLSLYVYLKWGYKRW